MKIINIKGTIIPKQNKWIYDWLEYPYTTTDDVINSLQEANGDDVEVMINCYGGSVYDGYEIYTALRDYKGDVLIKIVGLAASAASFIAMAGKCLMSPVAEMMIHNASTGAQGPHQVMDSTSAMLQVTDSSIAKAYMIKTGKSESEIRTLMENETWLTAENAKELGLIDGIMFEKNDNNIAPVLFNSVPVPSLRAIEELEKCGSIEELKKKLAMNAEELKKNINQPIILNSLNKNEGVKKMELENFKKDYPDLYNQVLEDGKNNGIQNERNRIKDIEDLAMPGNEELVNKAKFETGITAEKLAVEIIKAEKGKGTNYLNNRQEDIDESKVAEVKPTNEGAFKKNSEDDEEMVNSFASALNKRKGAK